MKRGYYPKVINRNSRIVSKISEIKEDHPFWGYRRVWAHLSFIDGVKISKNRVYRLMKLNSLLVKPNMRLKAKIINISKLFFFLTFLILLTKLSLNFQTAIALESPIKESEESEVMNQDHDFTKRIQESLASSTTKTAEKFAGVIEEGLERVIDKSPEKLRIIGHANMFAGITIFSTLVCIMLILSSWTLAKVTNKILLRQIDATLNLSWSNLFLNSLQKPIYYFILIYGAYAAFISFCVTLSLPIEFKFIQTAVKKIVDLSGISLVIYFIYKLVILTEIKIQNKLKGANNVNSLLLPTTARIVKIIIGIMGVILIFQNLTGIKITPIITSLGIGGLAIAFAAKDSIANFFGTLTVLFDKPFSLGDWIIINRYEGIVENVGFRSTRLRLFNGNLISLPNELVVNSTLENVSKRPFLRHSIDIAITYDTPPQKIKDTISTLKWLLKNREGMKKDNPACIFLDTLGDWSINIKIIVYYHPPDLWLFRKWKEDLYLDIIENLNEMKVNFAFPTQTLYLSKNDCKSKKA